MKPETENWVKLAKEDYEDALYLFKGARYPNAVYHLCQAIEKLLKGAQTELVNQVPKKIHNLRTLGKESGLSLSEAQYKILKDLRKHYERVRYRDLSRAHYNTKAKVEPIMNQGREIYQWILTALNNH
jgi:HEPN domain-containing protein